MHVYCFLAYRYATHRDIRALGLDMFRQFLVLQVYMYLLMVLDSIRQFSSAAGMHLLMGLDMFRLRQV